jgi:hypothetical protein
VIDRAFRLPRLWSNRVLREIGPAFAGEVANVSGWRDADKEGKRYRDYFPSATAYYVTNHAGERGTDDAADVTDFRLDLTGELPAELVGRFDVVLSHTVLEHVFRADLAFANLCRMARDAVIVVVPFAQEVHYTDSYGDYWRYTPMGLRALFEQNGFTVVYDAASPEPDAGVYLLSVGVRDPARWAGKLPAHAPPGRGTGGWIGRPRRGLLHRLATAVRRRGRKG